MKNWKKWGVSLGILATSLLALTACGSGESNSGSAGGSGKKELVVWTFTDELSKMINDYYKPAHEDLDYEIKVVEIPSDQFETKLDPVLGTKDAPDVIALESAFVKKYVESGLMADIGELGLDEASKDTYQYVKDVGTDKDGVLHALAWQGAPGGFYYRESMAKDLLGLEDVDKVQEALSDYNKFYEVAKEVKEKKQWGRLYDFQCSRFGKTVFWTSGPWLGRRWKTCY